MDISSTNIFSSSTEDLNDFLQLVHSHYCTHFTTLPYVSAVSILRGNLLISSIHVYCIMQVHKYGRFNISLLQKDILTTYLAGKPLVEGADSIRIPFKFKMGDQQMASPYLVE